MKRNEVAGLWPSPTAKKNIFPWFLDRIETIDQYLLSARHCSKHFDSSVQFSQHHLQFIDETAEAQGVVQLVISYTANKWHHQDLNPGLSESRAHAFNHFTKGFLRVDVDQGRTSE